MSGSYTSAWFQERAFHSLKRIADRTFDYSDSLLLYPPGTESEYESIQQGDDPYAELITKPERKYLEEIAERIVKQLPAEFEYIDLGPGTARKEQFIFGAAKKAGKTFIYRPVDISEQYLIQAAEHASAQQIAVMPIQSSFEELAQQTQDSHPPRFVSLGLTFTNYNPQDILPLLKNIAGPCGFIFIDAQMRDRVDMQKIVDTYAKDVRAMADSKLRLLGLDPAHDVSDYKTDDGVKLWCTLGRSNRILEAHGVYAGDTLLMLQSLRYTKALFEKAIEAAGFPYILFDTSDPFVGALIIVPKV